MELKPHIREFLSYISTDFISPQSHIAAVFERPRKPAIINNQEQFFVELYDTMHKKIQEGIVFQRKQTDKEKRMVHFTEGVVSHNDVFSLKEIGEVLKFIAEQYSDREYRHLRSYLDGKSFIRAPHELAGLPIFISEVISEEGKRLSDERSQLFDPSRLKFHDTDASASVSETLDGDDDEEPAVEQSVEKERQRNIERKRVEWRAIATDQWIADTFFMGNYEYYSSDIALSDEQQDIITQFERETGYDFDTRLLREAMGITYLTPYQIKAIFHFTNFNYIVTPRRSGKSLIATYFAVRQIFVKKQTVLYVMPNETYFYQPMTYFDRLTDRIKKADPNIKLSYSAGTLRNLYTKSSILMVSARMAHGIRSFDADLTIMDEASFSPESEYLNLQTIVEQKVGTTDYGSILCISTLDRNSPVNWFYREVVNSEIASAMMEEDSHRYFSLRVSIFENPFYTPEAKRRLIARFQNDEAALRAEVFAEFAPKNTQIPTSFFPLELIDCPVLGKDMMMPFVAPPAGELTSIIIGYDPAKKNSKSAVTIMAVYKKPPDLTSSRQANGVALGRNNVYHGKAQVIIIGGFHFPPHVGFIEQIQSWITLLVESLKRYTPNVIVAFDENGIGAPLHEIINWGGLRNLPVHYSSSRQGDAMRTTTMRNGILYTDKKYLISHFLLSAEKGTLISANIQLIKNMVAALGEVDPTDTNNRESSKVLGMDILNSTAIAVMAISYFEPDILRGSHLGDAQAERDRRRGEEIFKYARKLLLGPKSWGKNPTQIRRERGKRFGY